MKLVADVAAALFAAAYQVSLDLEVTQPKALAYLEDSETTIFTQSWPNTSCGFGGFAGQAFTSATTAVFLLGNTAYVVIAGKFAYKVENYWKSTEFMYDLSNRKMAGQEQFLRDKKYTDVKDQDDSGEDSGAEE